MAKDPIKKAENGTYYFRANLGYHPVTGKQIQKYRSGFSTKKEARAEYSKLILASTEELADKKEDITFKKFIEEIYLPWYKTQVKESTYKNRYSTIQKHFAYFYKKKVSEIEAINVQTWQLKLAKQFSPYSLPSRNIPAYIPDTRISRIRWRITKLQRLHRYVSSRSL